MCFQTLDLCFSSWAESLAFQHFVTCSCHSIVVLVAVILDFFIGIQLLSFKG